MYFTSFTFIIFAIILFILYYTVFKDYQWQLLLIASIIFFAYSGMSNLIYILLTICTTYYSGLKIQKLYKIEKLETKGVARKERRIIREKYDKEKRKWLILCLVFNFSILGIIKYTNFFIHNFNILSIKISGEPKFGLLNILVPLGISFYTFQSMSYIIDTYRGVIKESASFLKFSLFVMYFPQMIQGPISRYGDLSKTLYVKKEYVETNIQKGLFRVLCGFFKKMVVADRLIVAVKTMVDNPDLYQGFFVICVMLFYAITLYADFTGGIDITIGVSKILGIDVEENFNRPFYSVSTADYWRRWHMTMGSWFRDYLFYPISISKPMGKFYNFSKRVFGDKIGRRIPVHLSIILLWFLTGLWHGASWNFIVWGLLNGVIIIISEELAPAYKWFHNKFSIGNKKGYKAFQIVRTFILMCAVRTLDVYRNVGTTFRMYKSIFTDFSLNTETINKLLNIGLSNYDYLVLIFSIIAMIIGGYLINNKKIEITIIPRFLRYIAYGSLVLIVIVIGMYGFGFDANQFIYNQF